MFGIAFDPDRQLVATSTFPDGTCAAGEVFDWRARGMRAIDVLAMFRSGLLTHVMAPAPVSANEPSRVAVYNGSPGETISIRTPEQQQAERLTRRERRALRNQG